MIDEDDEDFLRTICTCTGFQGETNASLEVPGPTWRDKHLTFRVGLPSRMCEVITLIAPTVRLDGSSCPDSISVPEKTEIFLNAKSFKLAFQLNAVGSIPV